jgi:hypothetical protein
MIKSVFGYCRIHSKATPPRVYSKIQNELKNKDLIPNLNSTSDHIQSLERAQTSQLLEPIIEKSLKWKGLISRLERDGGKKVFL